MAENQDLEENQNVTENVNVPEAENQPENVNVPKAENQPENVNVAKNVAKTDNLAVDTRRPYFKCSTYKTYCSSKFGFQVLVRMRCGLLWGKTRLD
ncbi:hypothetical protein Q3G72_015676 [Acer saccharum]|nr:hypothetical protein Q3G72_015676 [Acer saccharum]